MIRFENISKSFGQKTVVRDLNLTIPAGGVHFIVGFSGAGKSVLIRHLVGLLKPDSGRCFVDELEVSALEGRALAPVRERCQMVFQHATLFDSMTMRENIALPLRKRFKLKRQAANSRADHYLELVNCSTVADRLPAEVGEGVQKRVAIARAVAMQPQYILYDEPTTGLSPLDARHTDELISRLAHQEHITAIVVSHDMTSVRTIADRVHFLYDTQLYFSGSAEDFFKNQSPVIQGFVNPGGFLTDERTGI